MHHYISILFLCVMGAKETYQYTIIPMGNPAPYDLGKSKCDLPVPVQPTCKGVGPLQKRYSYHNGTGKCVLVELPTCFSANGNIFHSRKNCLDLCNSQSACLKPGDKKIKDLHYRYNKDKDTCEFIIPKGHKRRLQKAIENAFPDEGDCESMCKPKNTSLTSVP
ncbi:hypothetical protein MTO96_016870 [Rhipicephalus appendiculatus]|uniref:Pancreatic trypsin inhibitor n=1 Tax=Rhipicephalus appendiculatus TaxID=34631 RepID=A0A131Z5Y9_RHIAP